MKYELYITKKKASIKELDLVVTGEDRNSNIRRIILQACKRRGKKITILSPLKRIYFSLIKDGDTVELRNFKKLYKERFEIVFSKELNEKFYNSSKKNNSFKKAMQIYYKSKQWKLKRQKILNRDKGICQECGEIGNTVHHLTYKNFKKEQPKDLVCLCKKCHDKIHRNKFNKRTVKK